MSWNKYKEKKPHRSEYYLIIARECSPDVSYYSKEYDRWGYCHSEVILWHPMPAAPDFDFDW